MAYVVLTPTEKRILLNVAKRACVDPEEDIMRVLVNFKTKDVEVLEDTAPDW